MLNSSKAEINLLKIQHKIAPILTTKLLMPKLSPYFISRPRLLNRLNEGLDYRLTLVTSVTGAGKTSLLTDWANCLTIPVAWLSLDQADNDATRFWLHFIEALEGLQPGISRAAQLMFESLYRSPLEAILTVLLNELAVLPQKLCLIIDDFQFIDTPSLCKALTFLIENLPPTVHLCLAGRSFSNLPLAKWRVKGFMYELTNSALVFTTDEITNFLGTTLKVTVKPEAIEDFARKSEGWATALYLTLLSAHNNPKFNLAEFLRNFDSSHYAIADYLNAEIFAVQPESVQNFLLKTAVLETLNPVACNYLTGRTDGREILQALAERNLFLIPLDETRQIFRYHHFFKEFLQYKLNLLRPECLNHLHVQAGYWCQHNNYLEEAVKHALLAQDYRTALERTKIIIDHKLKHGRLMRLLGWLDSLPTTFLQSEPHLQLIQAWLLAQTDQLSQAEMLLQQLDAFSLPDGEVTTVRTRLVLMQGNPVTAQSYAQLALTQLSEHNLTMRSEVQICLGHSYIQTGHLTKALEALTKALELTETAGDIRSALFTLSYLARLYKIQGQPQAAARLYEQAIRLIKSFDLDNAVNVPVSAVGAIYVGMGELFYDQEQPEAARFYLEKGIAIGEQGCLKVLVPGYLALARWWQSQGDIKLAQILVQKAARLVPGHHIEIGQLAWGLPSQANTNFASNWAMQVGLNAANENIVDKNTTKLELNPSQSVTSREQTLLRLVAQGFSNQKIAQELIISTGTVKVHLHNIYQKLGVNGRIAALKRAKELKILP